MKKQKKKREKIERIQKKRKEELTNKLEEPVQPGQVEGDAAHSGLVRDDSQVVLVCTISFFPSFFAYFFLLLLLLFLFLL